MSKPCAVCESPLAHWRLTALYYSPKNDIDGMKMVDLAYCDGCHDKFSTILLERMYLDHTMPMPNLRCFICRTSDYILTTDHVWRLSVTTREPESHKFDIPLTVCDSCTGKYDIGPMHELCEKYMIKAGPDF